MADNKTLIKGGLRDAGMEQHGKSAMDNRIHRAGFQRNFSFAENRFPDRVKNPVKRQSYNSGFMNPEQYKIFIQGQLAWYKNLQKQ